MDMLTEPAVHEAVRVVLGSATRDHLVAAWPALRPVSTLPLVREAIEAARWRWGAAVKPQWAGSASRYQRDLAHWLLALPGMEVTWPWALPQLARAQLTWTGGVEVVDALLAERRRRVSTYPVWSLLPLVGPPATQAWPASPTPLRDAA